VRPYSLHITIFAALQGFMRAFTFLLLLCGIASHCSAQTNSALPQSAIPDTVLMDDGKTIVSHVIDTIGYSIEITRPHRKHKKIEIDKDNIFQITFGSSGKTVVFYFHDTLTGNDLTVDEAHKFIEGEQDAERGFHALGTSAIAFAIGTASGVIGASFFALAPSFAYAGFMSYRYVKIRHRSVKRIENVHHDGYLYGYSYVSRRKRTTKALLWGGIGIVAGTIIHYIILNNN